MTGRDSILRKITQGKENEIWSPFWDRVVREVLSKEMIFKHRPEQNEVISHAYIWARALKADARTSIKGLG